MITTRAELAAVLGSPKVKALLAGVPPGRLATVILEAAGPPQDQPVGERWDAVEWVLTHQLGVHPDGHVGRSPILPLTAWENLLTRAVAPDGAAAMAAAEWDHRPIEDA